MSNPALEECIALFEVSIRRFAPHLKDTFEQWKRNPCYDFAILLQAYLEDVQKRLDETMAELENIYADH